MRAHGLHEDPCGNSGYALFADGVTVTHLFPHALYERYSSYTLCRQGTDIGKGLTHHLRFAHRCTKGFKLAGTSHHHANAHTAHWDFWGKDGQWVTWNGTGDFEWRDGWAIAYAPNLHNWNLFAAWPARSFATCDRIPGYRF